MFLLVYLAGAKENLEINAKTSELTSLGAKIIFYKAINLFNLL